MDRIELHGTTRLEPPAACTRPERRAFERLVRQGFDGSDRTLPDRILAASCLAFHYAPDGELVAIAGLKQPGEPYRREVFTKADARLDGADFELELGWVYVVPEHRGKGIAMDLCRLLLERERGSRVFATTRTDNAAMIRILFALGFVRAGRAYARRDEVLALFVRP